MSTYVMSDIHGCYNEFHQMLDTIGFSPSDELILAGDYIDRGKQTLEMLYWLEDRPENVILLQGNHEAEYVAYIDIMKMVNDHEDLKLDVSSYKDSKELYDVVYYYTARSGFPFDVYGTVENLIEEEGFTVEDLAEYADIFRNLGGSTSLSMRAMQKTCPRAANIRRWKIIICMPEMKHI